MINLKNIQYKISQKIILQNIDLNIQEGKTTVIMGKNGSGKSTLLKLLNQIIKPTSGLFDSTLSKPVPMLFQKPLMLQNSVNYNYHILQKIKKHQINDFWFKKFDLSHLSNQKMNSLSEGEKQKIFISSLLITGVVSAALSRVYLCQHHLQDVLVGGIIGAALFFLFFVINSKIFPVLSK